MTRFTQALSLVTALLSGSVYDASPVNAASHSASTNTVAVQAVDLDDESRRIMMDARIAMGKELQRR